MDKKNKGGGEVMGSADKKMTCFVLNVNYYIYLHYIYVDKILQNLN